MLNLLQMHITASVDDNEYGNDSGCVTAAACGLLNLRVIALAAGFAYEIETVYGLAIVSTSAHEFG